jgi:DNA-binding SARP family transcriptional activator
VSPEYRLLGPLEILIAGRAVDAGGSRRRSVLAMLVLEAGRTVSVTRLVEGVWGEDAPETAVTALQGHISHLRRALGDDRIITRAPGYRLECAAGDVDVQRFAALLERGREALAAGDPEAALAGLDAAGALWRGEPLEDLRDAPFATAAVPPLDALGADARDLRADAQLALGQHEALIGDLRAALAADPLRERPRLQLMTALHRAGRRTEALETYEAGRRSYSEELGIEPGAALRALHEEILRDEGAPVRSAPRPAPARRRGPLIAAVVAVGAAAAVVAVALGGGDPSPAPALTRAGLIRIDPDRMAVAAVSSLGGTPTSIAAGRGRAWAIDADDQTVTEVARSGRKVRTFATGASPVDVAIARDGLWLAEGRVRDTQTLTPQTVSAAHLAGSLLAVRSRLRLPTATGEAQESVTQRIAVTDRATWVIAADGRLVRIAGERIDRVLDVHASAVAGDGEHAWVLTTDGTLTALDDPAQAPIDVPPGTGSIAVGGGALWVLDPGLGRLTRLAPADPEQARAVDLGPGAGAIAYGHGAAWVADAAGQRVLRLDARTGAPDGAVRLGAVPRDITVSADGVWVSATPRTTALASGCTGRAGDDDLVVAAELPLRRDPRSPTDEMAAAIRDVVARHGGRAGPHRVTLIVCDDSTAQAANYDPEKCAADARGYARDTRVVAVVGPYNSGCAARQIPIAAAAPGGPLAMLSPTATDPLVRGAGAFRRLAATDADQARAMAEELRSRGIRRVYVLDDSDGAATYGLTVSSFFAAAARRAGLMVAGRGSWRRPGYARRIARTRPDAVYVSGSLDRGAGAILRRLAPRIGVLAGPDLLLPVASLYASSDGAARGMLLSATLPHGPVAAATEATEIVLGAIARSDGTRRSVARALLATHRSDAPVGILRVRRGGGSDERLSTEGAELLRLR